MRTDVADPMGHDGKDEIVGRLPVEGGARRPPDSLAEHVAGHQFAVGQDVPLHNMVEVSREPYRC